MTRTEVYLICDSCGFEYKFPHRNEPELKEFAEKHGWECDKTGDYCPECKETYI